MYIPTMEKCILLFIGVILLQTAVPIKSKCLTFCDHAFSAVRTSSTGSPTSPLPFTNNLVNNDNVSDGSYFTAPEAGIYWMHWSAGLASATSYTICLRGISPSDQCLSRTSTNYPGGTPVTTSRDILVQLNVSRQLYISTDAGVYSDSYYQTSFSGFYLDKLFAPLVAFHVVCQSDIRGASAGTRVSYSLALLDTHNAWNISAYEYVVPVTGTYVISVVTASYPSTIFRHALYGGSTPLVYSTFQYTSYSGSMTTSRTIIKYFNSGDSIYSLFSTTSSIVANSAYPTALYGFLYSSYVPVSWCVQANTGDYLTGEVNPVGFNKIIENEGSGWSASTNKYFVPRAGVYYIHLSAGLYLTTKLELMLNSAIVANLHHTPGISSYCITVSRAIILRLRQGDVLHVKLPSGFSVSTSSSCETMFSGFLIN